MAQIRNRFEIQESLNDGIACKKLPNFFEKNDEINPLLGAGLSILTHVVFFSLMFVLAYFNGLIFSMLPKPELPERNIEFKLVQNESKPPINKNTKIRSDRDSQAGGKHDPKKPISEPSMPKAAQQKKSVAKKSQPAQQPKKVVQKQVAKQQPVKTPQKPTIKQQPTKTVQKTPVQQPQQIVSKPTPIKPAAPTPAMKPSVKPAVKPQGVNTPSAPKIATAPKSPFVVQAPSVKAPVGSTYKPAGVSGTSSASGTSGSAPAPKFSSQGGSSSYGSSSKSSSSSSGSYASRGSSGGGYGSGGNPGPGNPNGTPGIDAIRQPNWGPYMRDLEQRIKRNWTPPKGDSSKRVVITFTIGRDGRLLSHKVTKSSGVPLADRAAMSAIELTAPFRPLPPEFRGQSVPIEFTFDYNVLNSVLR